MKHIFLRKKSLGIGLIEVLITTVVVAVGLLAIGSLESGLIGSSRSNKTQAECLALANTKIEQLRDTISMLGYEAIASSDADESIVGITETFTRAWDVVLLTDPEAKNINVQVAWGDASIERQCVAQTVIAYDNTGNSGLVANQAGSGGGATSPSTNAESSDEISEYVDISPGTTEGAVVTVDEQTYIALKSVSDTIQKGVLANLCADYTDPAVTLLDDPDLLPEEQVKVRRIDYDGIAGDEAIELFEVAGDYCIPRIRFNGGVIIPIRGIVYSGATVGSGANEQPLSVELFTFNASETGAYCVFKPEDGSRSEPYVCYVGGNCTGAESGDDADVLQCQTSPVSALKVGEGGWRGKVGLLGVADGNSGGRNVCLGEELIGTPATLDTARNYYVRRGGINEGINQAYSCHNFLIIDVQPTEAKVSEECIIRKDELESDLNISLRLASKTIQRTIAAGNNIFVPTANETACYATGDSHDLSVTLIVPNGTSTLIAGGLQSSLGSNCTVSDTETNYSCVELNSTAGEGTLTYTGGTSSGNTCTASQSYTVTAGSSDRSMSLAVTCTTNRTISVVVNPDSSDTGSISGIWVTASGASCSSSLPFTCTVASDWTGTITASATCSGTPSTVTGSIGVSASGTTAAINLDNCAAATSLTTPLLTWQGTSDPKSISWPAVTGAAEYKIYQCTELNDNNLTSCVPVISGSSQTAEGLVIGDPGNKNTICVKVVAFSGAVDSTPSGVMCIHQKSGNYSYTP